MRSLSDLTHYEVLEIPREATPRDIERAYKIARATWGEHSIGGYSLYSEAELAAFRERVETAARVLSDPELRREYDDEIAGEAAEHGEEGDVQIAFALAAEPVPSAREESADLAAFEEDDGPWDGARLRRARLQRGRELEQIADVTKVTHTYLRFIEEERFDDLPADVYVRGFVIAMARTLGLEADRVAADYMERVRESRVQPAPARRRSRQA